MLKLPYMNGAFKELLASINAATPEDFKKTCSFVEEMNMLADSVDAFNAMARRCFAEGAEHDAGLADSRLTAFFHRATVHLIDNRCSRPRQAAVIFAIIARSRVIVWDIIAGKKDSNEALRNCCGLRWIEECLEESMRVNLIAHPTLVFGDIVKDLKEEAICYARMISLQSFDVLTAGLMEKMRERYPAVKNAFPLSSEYNSLKDDNEKFVSRQTERLT